MVGNPNHPKKGSMIASDPLLSLQEIKEMKEYLKSHSDSPEGMRNYALWVFGTNTAFRGGDLLNLTVGQVKNLKPGDTLLTREQKTRKTRPVTLNHAAYGAIQPLLRNQSDADPLFRSQRSGALTVGALGNLVKMWTRKCGFKGKYSSHTLRKTFGRMQVVEFGLPVYVLTEILNHSSEKITMTYIGLQAEDVAAAYRNEL